MTAAIVAVSTSYREDVQNVFPSLPFQTCAVFPVLLEGRKLQVLTSYFLTGLRPRDGSIPVSSLLSFLVACATDVIDRWLSHARSPFEVAHVT